MINDVFHRRMYGAVQIVFGLCFLFLELLPITYYLLSVHVVCGLIIIFFGNTKSLLFYRILELINICLMVYLIISFWYTNLHYDTYNVAKVELLFFWFEYIIYIIFRYVFEYNLCLFESNKKKR